MIAEVYPVRRMPRSQGVYEYQIPDDIKTTPGMAVLIPLRRETVFGIVKSIKTHTTVPKGKLRAIVSCWTELDLTPEILNLFETVAEDLVQSTGSILFAALPLPPKKVTKPAVPLKAIPLTLPANEAPAYQDLTTQIVNQGSKKFVRVPDIRRAAALVAGIEKQKKTSELTFVFAPTDRDAEGIARALQAYNPRLVTGSTKPAERFFSWQELKQKKSTLLIGTRVAALFPLSPDYLCVVRSSHASHEQANRNPRFDTRVIAHMRHELNPQSRLIFLSSFPRVDDYKPFVLNEDFLSPSNLPSPIPADQGQERQVSPHPLLTATMIDQTRMCLDQKKRVLCIFNRKGGFRSLRCRLCSYTPLCNVCVRPYVYKNEQMVCPTCDKKTPVFSGCPNCKKTSMKPAGYGNAALKKVLVDLFPQAAVGIWDKEHAKDPNTPITLVTDFVLETMSPFASLGIGLVAHLDTDIPLSGATFRASENALINLSEWHAVAHSEKARYLFQSEHPQLFLEASQNPPDFLAKEGSMREAYHNPPARRIIEAIEDTNAKPSLLEALADNIRSQDSEAFVYLHPVNAAAKTRHLEISLLPHHFARLAPIFRSLPDSIRLNTHAYASYGTP